MTARKQAANQNFPRQNLGIRSCTGTIFGEPSPILVRLIHEEVVALPGLMSVFRDGGCTVMASAFDSLDAASVPSPGEPDICVIGNLDACGTDLLRAFRTVHPTALLVLFDLAITDDSDLRQCEPVCRAMGFEDFLPAYSCREQLIAGVARLCKSARLKAAGLPVSPAAARARLRPV